MRLRNRFTGACAAGGAAGAFAAGRAVGVCEVEAVEARLAEVVGGCVVEVRADLDEVVDFTATIVRTEGCTVKQESV